MDNSETRNSSMVGLGGGIESSSSGLGGLGGGGGGGGTTSGVDYLNASELLLNDDEEAGIEDEEDGEDAAIRSVYSTNYRLVGIVVHSGQANGGHYYSFIQNRTTSEQSNTSCVAATSSGSSSGGVGESNGQSASVDLSSSSSSSSSASLNENNWFKFDDNEVSEFRMDDDEMRAQCYGGDYTGEVYDNVMKRMAFKKQKRWWNAYILFYERIKHVENNSTTTTKKEEPANKSTASTTAAAGNSNKEERSESKNTTTTTVATSCVVNMPGYVVKSVHKKNIKFLHHRHHFSPEYFQFVKKLVQANLSLCQNDIPLVTTQELFFCVVFGFLVYFGFILI